MAEHIEYQGNFSGSQIDTLLAKIQSSQVFRTEEKTKLASLVNYDDTEVKEDISDIETSLNSHKSDTTNPHQVTKAQVGLGNVDNTSDANKPISTATQAGLNNKVDKVDGKGLSTNDFTDSEKTQISANKAGIGAVANRGSKNLFKNTANSKTNNGVTFSVSADGTVSTSGSATPAVAVLEIGSVTLSAGTYIVSGCPEGGDWSGGANKYRIRVAVNGAWRGDEKGNGFELTLNEGDTVSLQVNTAIGLDATGLVFKPMIRDAAIEDDSYQPYAMSNVELTGNISSIGAIIGKRVYSAFFGQDSGTAEYQIKASDFQTDTPNAQQCGIYIVYLIDWSPTPVVSIYTVGYSGGTTGYNVVTKIVGTDNLISVDANRKITYTGKGKISIYAMR